VRTALSLSRVVLAVVVAVGAQTAPANQADLDARVSRFFAQHGGWHDMNVPEADGRALYDLILERKYKRVLEIGTSTGRSGIWMAWALSKTGGRLTTIDIDEGRYREALRNFSEAGVSDFISARLGDAHDIVPRLDGPFDMVFVDADKDWYTNYAKAVLPKITSGGALTAHNVSPRGWSQMTGDFYKYVTSLPNLETSFRAGVFVAFKK
jgi:predicted O-methyltransferase YrrM